MPAAPSQLERLAEVAKLRSPEARRTLLCGMADILLTYKQRLSLTELRHFDAIMSHAAAQADTPVRRDLAERLSAPIADAANAPRGLIALLAKDEIEIAEPLLRRSAALRDEDLVAIIADRGPAHAGAIARRKALTPVVTSALAQQGDEDTLVSLLKNRGAAFDLKTMRAIANKARKLPALQEPLAARLDLPALILTQLYFFAPAPLKRDILKRADMLDPALVDAAETATRRKLAAHFAREGDHKDDFERQFITDKIEAGAVNETLLRALLGEKRRTEFLFAFAYLLAVDLENAKAIIDDNRFEALAVACRAAGLERQTFAKIVFGLLHEEGDKPRALRILDLYIKVPAEAAERIMRFWRMGAGAAHAARDRYERADFGGNDELLELRDRAKGW